jgi:hypothetical protein
MLDAIFDLLMNVICHKVGAASLKFLTFGRYSSEVAVKYFFTTITVGLVEIIIFIYVVFVIVKG